jgi:EamA-like transporter family
MVDIHQQTLDGERAGVERNFGRDQRGPTVAGKPHRWGTAQRAGRMSRVNCRRYRIQIALLDRPARVRRSQNVIQMLAQHACTFRDTVADRVVALPQPRSNWPQAAWGDIALQAFTQGLLTAIISYLLYGRAVGILGASSGAAFAALCPAMTALIAIPVLGEWPTTIDWMAIIVISVGVYIVSGGPLPQRRTW